MLGPEGPAAVGVQVAEDRWVALQRVDLHAGCGPKCGVEVLDDGKITCILDTELVVPAVISENHGGAVWHTTSLRKS